MNTYNLQTEYKSRSITYKELEERNGYIIYSCSGLGRKEWYEVYKPVLVPYFKIAGKEIEEHYRLPKDEDFGTHAWTFNNLEQARNKVS